MQGFINKIAFKHGKGKRGDWTLTSACIEHDGTETWYSAGFDPFPFQEGQYVDFTSKTDDKGYQILDSCKVIPTPAKAVAAPSSQEPTAAAHQDVVPQHSVKDSTIQYQNARGNALVLVGLLLEHNGLPMSSSAAKAGVAARFEEITAFVDKLTVQYFNDTQSLRVLRKVVDAGAETDATSPGEAPGTANASQADTD